MFLQGHILSTTRYGSKYLHYSSVLVNQTSDTLWKILQGFIQRFNYLPTEGIKISVTQCSMCDFDSHFTCLQHNWSSMWSFAIFSQTHKKKKQNNRIDKKEEAEHVWNKMLDECVGKHNTFDGASQHHWKIFQSWIWMNLWSFSPSTGIPACQVKRQKK